MFYGKRWRGVANPAEGSARIRPRKPLPWSPREFMQAAANIEEAAARGAGGDGILSSLV